MWLNIPCMDPMCIWKWEKQPLEGPKTTGSWIVHVKVVVLFERGPATSEYSPNKAFK